MVIGIRSAPTTRRRGKERVLTPEEKHNRLVMSRLSL